MRNPSSKVVLVVVAIWSAVMPLASQTPPAQKPSFEVASVKAAPEHGRQTLNVPPGGRFSATGFTLKWLIGFAYRLREDQMLGGATWITKDLWDIQAKAAEGTVPPRSPATDSTKPDAIALMLQSLLEERFQLRLHREMREFPVYLLTVARGGPKLKLSDDQSDVNGQPPEIPIERRRGMIRRTQDGLTANAVRLSFMTNFLSSQLGRPVLDKTGLEGMFDFKLPWLPPPIPPSGVPAGPDAASDPSGASIFTAIQELGLKLESSKAALEVLVIDSVQKPSEN